MAFYITSTSNSFHAQETRNDIVTNTGFAMTWAAGSFWTQLFEAITRRSGCRAPLSQASARQIQPTPPPILDPSEGALSLQYNQCTHMCHADVDWWQLSYTAGVSRKMIIKWKQQNVRISPKLEGGITTDGCRNAIFFFSFRSVELLFQRPKQPGCHLAHIWQNHKISFFFLIWRVSRQGAPLAKSLTLSKQILLKCTN